MGLSNVELQRRYIARLKARAKADVHARADRARIRELEKELIRAKARIQKLENQNAALMTAKDRIR